MREDIEKRLEILREKYKNAQSPQERRVIELMARPLKSLQIKYGNYEHKT